MINLWEHAFDESQRASKAREIEASRAHGNADRYKRERDEERERADKLLARLQVILKAVGNPSFPLCDACSGDGVVDVWSSVTKRYVSAICPSCGGTGNDYIQGRQEGNQ